MHFGDMQEGAKKDLSAPKGVSCDYNRGPSRRINLHVGVGAAILAPTIDANLFVRHVSRLSKAKGFEPHGARKGVYGQDDAGNPPGH